MTASLSVQPIGASYQIANTRSTTVDQEHSEDTISEAIKSSDVHGNSDTQNGALNCYERSSESALTIYGHNTYLINSPYLEREHQLDLTDLDVQSQLLAQALTVLAPTTSSFATIAYQDSLNWLDVFESLRFLASAQKYHFIKQDFYVVEFRSKLISDINRLLLFELDKESHREATASGGLLRYWFGEPDAERRNLATCIWRSKTDATLGGRGPWHKRARSIVPQMYEKIEIKGLRLTIDEHVSAWSFEPWA